MFISKIVCKFKYFFLGKFVDCFRLWDDILVIFSIDNGGLFDFGGYNWFLCGMKYIVWEGGVCGIVFVYGNLLK